MKLPFLSGPRQSKKAYWGILLKESAGLCFLFEEKDGKLYLTKQKAFSYSDGWERVVEDVDEVLALLEKETGVQTDLCIYFIFSHLIDQATKEIARPYLTKMKDIAKNLDLKAIGYIEVIDAIHEYVEHDRKTSLSGLVIEMDNSELTLFLYKSGHKLQTVHISRTDSLESDIEFNLEKYMGATVLPSKMFLYDSSDLSKQSTQLLTYSWKKNLFAQPPVVEVIQTNTVNESLRSLLEKQLCNNKDRIEEESTVKETLGFVIGKDITEKEAERRSAEQDEKGGDLNNKQTIFSGHRFRLPQIGNKGIIILTRFVFPVVFIVGLVFIGLFFFHIAKVEFVIPHTEKTLEKGIEVSEKADGEGIVVLEKKVSTVSVEDKKDTTGRRYVGERSAGEVTLYSYDEKERTFSKGTKLQTGSISFELDDQTRIPSSQFASDGITKTPGKVKAKVHATDIGEDGNIDKNKRFSVSDISSNTVFGINENTFSGGTKKAIRTVARSDVDLLRSSVLDKTVSSQDKVSSSGGSIVVIPELSSKQLTQEVFSAEVGEESNTLSLKADVELVTYYLSKDRIQAVMNEQVQKNKPEGYLIDSASIEIAQVKKQKNGTAAIIVKEVVDYKMDVDIGGVKKALILQPVENSKRILQDRFSFQNVYISVQPDIFPISQYLPIRTENIQIIIQK